MNDEMVLSFTYKELFVRKGHRNTERVHFGTEERLDVRRIMPADAPKAYRLHDDQAAAIPEPYYVRAMDDRLMWPLLSEGKFLSPSRFLELAAAGHSAVLMILGLEPVTPSDRTPEEFFKNIATKDRFSAELNRNRQLATVRENLSKIVFCRERVLVDAGTPVYYVIPVSMTAQYHVFAGPSSRKMSNQILGLPGPHPWDAPKSAGRGLIYGIHEIDETVARLGVQENVGSCGRIECLTPSYRKEAAVLACARELVDRLWVNSISGDESCRRLRASVPALAEARYLPDIREVPVATVLRQFVDMDYPAGCHDWDFMIGCAKDLLARMHKFCPEMLDAPDRPTVAKPK